MNYDEISESTYNDLALNSRFYEIYIQPLIKKQPRQEVYGFLLTHAFNAWRLGMDVDDIKLVSYVEKICSDIKKHNKDDLAKLFSTILSEQYDSGVKTKSADRILWESQKNKNFESQVSALFLIYKVYFENEFRLWSSGLYYYLDSKKLIKTKGTTPSSFVFIGASEKFNQLNALNSILDGINIKHFTKGFDNQIRNCGAGHYRWEILDNNKILLHVIESGTGREKRTIDISKKELENYVKECRKSIWILKTGMYIFLINNPDFEREIESKKVVKIKEIEEGLKDFAKNRSFVIKKFFLNEERTDLKLSIKYDKTVTPTSSQIYIGKSESYDILYLEEDDWAHYHILDIMQYVLLNLNVNNPPKVVYDVFDEDNKLITHLEFQTEELKKIFNSKEKYMPKPSVGEIPQRQIKFYIPIRVPYGFTKLLGVSVIKKELFESLLKKYTQK